MDVFRYMGIIEYHQGCSGPGKFGGCFGPIGNYYTIFGSELRFLTWHAVISVFIGLVLISVLYTLKKKEKIKLKISTSILISVIAVILFFFLLAYFFPVIALY